MHPVKTGGGGWPSPTPGRERRHPGGRDRHDHRPEPVVTAADQPTGITEQLTGLIRTNITLQPGDSGGPLVSPAEQMIGMDNTAASSQFQITRGRGRAWRRHSLQEQPHLAIPASQTVSVAAQIVEGDGPHRRHRLARRLRRVVLRPGAGQRASTGAGIVEVTAGTPAAAAGLALAT